MSLICNSIKKFLSYKITNSSFITGPTTTIIARNLLAPDHLVGVISTTVAVVAAVKVGRASTIAVVALAKVACAAAVLCHGQGQRTPETVRQRGWLEGRLFQMKAWFSSFGYED